MNYFLTYAVYVFVLSLLMGISTWKLFKKMGYNPAFAFIPFYNYFIILKETQHPKWWAVLSYLPIVGPIMMSVFHLYLMKKFGKTLVQQQILTVVLPFIYMASVNYSKDVEIEDEEAKFMFLTDEEKSVKKKESFLGSITFAVVFATIIHVFVTQPFGIPTGSMERTLLVGDFLFVNKWSYGYRMPMRPLAIPFLQGTIYDFQKDGNPKNDGKSYVDGVKLPYERILQFNKPQRSDIVVFNYPQDSVHTAIDRKDPYVKRCVAVAGDTFEMRGGKLFVNDKPETILGDQEEQHAFVVEASSEIDTKELFKRLEYISIARVNSQTVYFQEAIKKYNIKPENIVYVMQLTDARLKEIKSLPQVVSVREDILVKGDAAISYKDEARTKIDTAQSIFPVNKAWNQDWYGPVRIPKKGDVVAINKETLPMYRWIISEYEHNSVAERNGQIFINNQPAKNYTIKQDYYMMVGDNRDASLDARFFGFVPEENIVGKPMFTWMSIEGAFNDSSSSYQAEGWRFRWDRMFKATNTGEANKTSYWWIAAMILILFFGWEYFVKLFKKNKTEDE
ncbi:signal peptidase I [Chryseobacterium piscicola]|uniref:Signal peptidase I n=1 Tax=Chryseobacterium piscicola TaxID=551459 RepID=A0A1N7NWF4_9FLAO|nr:signal peptidase I [Chryseobacterium piscicola]PQA94212.1 signal peptidase I [Chryseobacterium piscicola]SIT02664.1 signal peptidase I [Chryseobacterium piscicola]